MNQNHSKPVQVIIPAKNKKVGLGDIEVRSKNPSGDIVSVQVRITHHLNPETHQFEPITDIYSMSSTAFSFNTNYYDKKIKFCKQKEVIEGTILYPTSMSPSYYIIWCIRIDKTNELINLPESMFNQI
jgi:hypothetical protein